MESAFDQLDLDAFLFFFFLFCSFFNLFIYSPTEICIYAVKYLLEERGLAEPTLSTLNILWPITPAPALNEFESRVTVHFVDNLVCTLDEPVTIIRMAA